MIISTIFAPNWFRMNISVIWIKRESGENPGQSRCCEALFNFLKNTHATDIFNIGKVSKRELVRRPAIIHFINQPPGLG